MNEKRFKLSPKLNKNRLNDNFVFLSESQEVRVSPKD